MPKDSAYMRRYRERRSAGIGKGKDSGSGGNAKNSNIISLNTENGEFNHKIIYNLEHRLQGKRWQNGEYDRFYLTNTDLGIEYNYSYDKKGRRTLESINLSTYGDINGVDMKLVNQLAGEISSTTATRMSNEIKNIWINLKTGKVEAKGEAGDTGLRKIFMERAKAEIYKAADKRGFKGTFKNWLGDEYESTHRLATYRDPISGEIRERYKTI